MREVDTAAHVLSNGHYGVLITRGGGGVSALDGYALTRWQPDPVVDTGGTLFYVRDRESAACWSISEAPMCGDVTGGLQINDDNVLLWSFGHGIEASCTITVAAGHNREHRRVRIRNRTERARQIELTSYCELALNTLAADAAHPAFSKLFVETDFDEQRAALVAWRRRRSPQDRSLYVGQKIVGATVREYETDRVRFLGRRRSLNDPLALAGSAILSRTTGPVLDPVFALRTITTLGPGEENTFDFVLCAADSRDALEQLLDDNITDAPAREHDADAIGLPSAWAETIAFDLSAREWQGQHPAHITAAPTNSNFGDFSDDGRTYVLRVAADTAPTPQPWINVLANEQFGTLVSETGAGYTWSGNSRENRLTPWSNDAVSDPPGELVYLHDVDSDELWSVFAAPCQVTHGFGYSRFERQSHGLEQKTIVFVPRHDPVKCALLTIVNRSGHTRRLRFTGYAQLVLGAGSADTRASVVTRGERNAVFATNQARGEFSERVAFANAVASTHITATGATGSRASFLSNPRQLDGRFGEALDPCAAVSIDFTIVPGETIECAFILGEADSEATAYACLARYESTVHLRGVLDEVSEFWDDLLSAVQVRSPARELDLMLNGWLTYQNLACRMWARSAFYQSGGAFGFRDQLQDSSALLYYDPRITREQILLHAAHQFVEGDVLHWWHPPLSKGIRTRFSDDLLWLPYIMLFYIERTGDWAILSEDVRFMEAETLEPQDDEIFVIPNESGQSASLYEHCCRAIDRSLTQGPHGLPLIGVGDWNDGMNRVGREGRGESVWLGFFLFEILDDFIPVCEARHDTDRVHRYMQYMTELGKVLNDSGWDGAWYRRAYYDSGEPIGAGESDECRIDALAQAWAVISGVAPADRAQQAIAEMRKQLVCEHDGIVRLLTPAFDKTPHDPGYIKGYLPGVRENGGQYTHAATWVVRALAELGERDEAVRVATMLSPVRHTRPDNLLRYGGEPYVIAADVYGEPPHVGRAGWTWYTGSAGWYQRVLLESILGFCLDNSDVVRLTPCIPRAWPGFTLRYRFPSGTTYVFNVRNTEGESTTSEGSFEDNAIIIPITHDGTVHEVHIEAGADVVPRYRSRVDASAAPLLRTTSL